MAKKYESKGYERFVNFTDAVVAIAATLLILPVVSAATELGDKSTNAFLEQMLPEFFMFLLSFVLIANFWWDHHRLFRRIDKFDSTLMYWNFIWLIGIVIMPVPTALVINGDAHDRLSIGFYIGTMFVISLMQTLMTDHIRRNPELLHSNTPLESRILGTIFLAISFVIGVSFPTVGLWSLMLMFFIPLAAKLKKRVGL